MHKTRHIIGDRGIGGEVRRSNQHMARPTKTFPLLTVTLIFLLFITVAGGERGKGVEGQLPLGWNPSLSGCRGTIHRLAGYATSPASTSLSVSNTEKDYICLRWPFSVSRFALRRDSVPCSSRGASYYNCRPGAEVNPYVRSCSAITRCRS
ncbi:unnamed protein product [Musa acuminata var. zebrina]